MTESTLPIFAANWKMHKGPDATREFVASFADRYTSRSDRRVVFFPPSISVEAFRRARDAAGRPDLELGVQDVHAEAEGAHTSAISAPMAVEAGASWALAGHSERRREFRDTDPDVAAKVERILACDLAPMVCVGETLEQREGGELRAVLERQVGAVVSAVGKGSAARLTWAYEPVWAIGTGRTAAPEDAAEAHAIVRSVLESAAGEGAGTTARVLYGGSVKPGNIAGLMGAAGVDGVLVGGASLDPADFAAICSSEAGTAPR